MTQTEIRQAVREWTVQRRIEWEERSAIMEYDGGLLRANAEKLAYYRMVNEKNHTLAASLLEDAT